MFRIRSVWSSLPALVGALVLACTFNGGAGPDGNDGGGGEGGDSSSEVEKTFGQKGGKIATANASLVFPPGALGENTKIKVSDLSKSEIADLPVTTDGVRLAGVPAKFTPHGLSFAQPVDAQLSYDEPEDDEPLVVMKLDDDEDTTWQLVPGTNVEAGKASFKINGFSYYGVFADPNGVAGDLYGEEPRGSGGTDSGGTSAGGTSSGAGGASSGGKGGTSSGGTEPGSGGVSSGGTGGVFQEGGYLDSPPFHGYGTTVAGPGAFIESDVETEPFPNCATGFTGPNQADWASLVYRVNQDEDGTVGEPVFVTDAGLWIGVNLGTQRSSLRVELHGASGAKWCAFIFGEVSPEFIPWSSFNGEACPIPQPGGSFDPQQSAIEALAVTVPSNFESEEDFDFCIESIAVGEEQTTR